MTEDLTIRLLPRARTLEGEKRDRVIDALGSIIGVLWLRYEHKASRDCLDAWLLDPASHLQELDHAIFKLRDIVVKGYATQDADDLRIQKNAQALAAETADRMTSLIAPYLAASAAPLNAQDEKRIGPPCAFSITSATSFIFRVGRSRPTRRRRNRLDRPCREAGIPRRHVCHALAHW